MLHRTILGAVALLFAAFLSFACSSDKAQSKPDPRPTEDMDIVCKDAQGNTGFIVNDVCYKTSEEACSARACADNEECITLKTEPPQIECKSMEADTDVVAE